MPSDGTRSRAPAWLAGAAACLALALSSLFPLENPDTFGHLAQGREIAELGHAPSHDTRSFFREPPAPFRNYEWLSDLGTFAVYRAGGADALIAGKALLLASTALLLVALSGLQGGARSAALCAVWLIAVIPAARFRFTVRPHLIALPLAALYLLGLGYLARAFGKGTRKGDALVICGLGALHALWVNLHGSHLLGLLITALYLAAAWSAADTRRRIAALLALQLGASCLSPYGPGIALDAIAHVFDPRYRALVAEWAPWSVEDPAAFAAALIVQTAALAVVVRPLWRGGHAARGLLLTSGVLALAAVRSVRFLDMYLLIAAPAIAIGLRGMLARLHPRGFALASAALAGVFAVVAAWSAPRLPPYLGLGRGEDHTLLPAASALWLREHAIAPRVLSAIEEAWYLMFAVPDARFLVDPRLPFYGPEHVARVRFAMENPAALPALLARYRVDTVVVHHTLHPFQPLMRAMENMPGFRLAAIEDRHALFIGNRLRLRPGSAAPRLALSGYEPDWLLAADAAREREIAAALERLPRHDNTQGYRSFVRALLAIKPLLRPGLHNGLAPPRDAREAALLARAQRGLALAAERTISVPVVHAYHALVAAARCDLATAEAALARAGARGPSRETLLGAQEIALRRGRRDEVATFVERARREPRAAADEWLAALAEGSGSPPRCP